MRTMFLTVLVCLGTATTGGAQSPATAATPRNHAEQTGLADGLLPEPRAIDRATDFAGRWESDADSPATDGFYPVVGGLITGGGWMSAGPGYRRRFRAGQMLVEGTAEISWRAYKQAQARFELPKLAGDHLTVGAQVRWQDFTQINYFGVGTDSLESLRSEYRLTDTDVLFGNVAARARDLNFDKSSYGAGLRVHTGRSTLGRLDLGHSREGWRLSFSLRDPFQLSRPAQTREIVPFVP